MEVGPVHVWQHFEKVMPLGETREWGKQKWGFLIRFQRYRGSTTNNWERNSTSTHDLVCGCLSTCRFPFFQTDVKRCVLRSCFFVWSMVSMTCCFLWRPHPDTVEDHVAPCASEERAAAALRHVEWGGINSWSTSWKTSMNLRIVVSWNRGSPKP